MPENYVLLERTELNASATSVTFANIPQSGYTDLKVVVSTRLSNTDSPILVNFNGVTTGYSWRRIYGNGSTASSLSGTDGYFLHGNTSSTTASTFSNAEFYVPNYTASQSKSISVDTALETNATAGELFMLAALWANNAAITSISLTPLTGSFVANSTFSLYGIAALGTTPAIAPKASGGNVIATDGTYWYHAFLSSGTFVPQTNLSCDYLVVAGGGGGAGQGGGGGAGGYRSFTSQSLSTTNYAVVIGAGGAGGPAGTSGSGALGTKGIDSSFNSHTSTGGGLGSNNFATASLGSGGSGGAAGLLDSTNSIGSGNTPSTSPSQGNNSGTTNGTVRAAGGGGGAGAVGGNGNSSNAGAGGAGSNSLSTWATATGTGVSGFYAGGGGGGSDDGSGFTAAGGTGGSGGGGAGCRGNSTAGGNGVTNTGSGGGGSGNTSGNVNTAAGGAGGSGIVIIRYPIAS